MENGSNYVTTTIIIDRFNADDSRVDGQWHSIEQLTSRDSQKTLKRFKDDAILLRNQLKTYVNEVDIIPNQQ